MEKIVRTAAPPGIDFSKDWVDFSSEERNRIGDALMEMTGGKCAYTGKNINSEVAVIDHFSPSKKSDWNNLFIVNPITNHLKGDKYDEKLIRPDEDNYEFDRYFDIDFDTGLIIPNSKANLDDKKRAEITIDTFGLNNEFIVAERKAEAFRQLDGYFSQGVLPISEPSVINGITINWASTYPYKFYADRAFKKFSKPINQFINEIHISSYYCVENFSIENLNNKREIYFLGENGDGKTITLQAIVMALKGFTQSVNGFDIKVADEKNNKYKYNDLSYIHSNVYAYGIEGRLRKHKNYEDKGYLSLFNSDVYLTDPIEWFKEVDRLERRGIGKLKLDTVKDLFKDLLENKVEIEDTKEGDYIFKEKDTILKFGQLSHGYRSVLIWLSDLLSRLAKSQPEVEHLKDYKAVVLVDEIGSFLHPRWEYTIVGKLRKLFPKIQWFFTTHSPIIALGASEDAVFYKLYKEDGITKVSEPFHAEAFDNRMLSSFVTSPLFNLPTARPATFQGNEYDLETGDYLYSQIHREVRKRMKNKPLQDTEIQDIISELLDEYESTGKI